MSIEDVTDLPEEQQVADDASSVSGDEEIPAGASVSVYSRGEKKARKAVLKLGLKPVPGITRVTLRRSKNILFVVSNPEVFRSVSSGCYIVFGEAKIEDLSQQANLAQQLQAASAADATAEAETTEAPEDKGKGKEKAEEAPVEAEPEEEGEVDETGLLEKDIQIVMAQAAVSRAKAVQALKKNDSDIVNRCVQLHSIYNMMNWFNQVLTTFLFFSSIMELTS
ncbi:nascent polypeptide-associated complex subunit alpha [Myxozyma melibiosi]|uniref:Nascent polypeptide-associated complex subunit alpha n=1 Tax=Myxozyma melibiosi TaxID=54550 RepID=A0ABR1F2Y2_9ASCO